MKRKEKKNPDDDDKKTLGPEEIAGGGCVNSDASITRTDTHTYCA